MFGSESARHARRGAVLVEPGLAERLAAERQVEAQFHRLVALGGKVEDGAPALGVGHRLGEHPRDLAARGADLRLRSEEHTSALQSLMRTSYAVFCLKTQKQHTHPEHIVSTTN